VQEFPHGHHHSSHPGATVAAGAVRVVIAVGQPGGWLLLVR